MDKVSYYFKIFKELWGNKRYRALIIIGCYALFFGFVLISLNTPGENTYNVTLVPKTPEVYILINVHIYDKDSKEVIVLSDAEYEDVQKTNTNIIPFPYKDELVSFREVVEELESQTGEDFETYRKGVARRIREAGYSTYDIEDDLIQKRWDEWISENILSEC